jgi:hypothetical protein
MKFYPLSQPPFYYGNNPANLEEFLGLWNYVQSMKWAQQDDQGIISDYWDWKLTDDMTPLRTGEQDQQRKELWWNLFTKHNKELIRELFGSKERQNPASAIDMVNIWVQESSGGTWHNPHDHGASNGWSFVWYLKFDSKAGHKGTEFYSPFNLASWMLEDKQEIKQGDVLIWPSNIIHAQPPSFTEEPRIIMSGNLIEASL